MYSLPPYQPARHLWGRFSGEFHFLLLCSPAESQPKASSWIGLYGCHTSTTVLLNCLFELGSQRFNSAYGFILKHLQHWYVILQLWNFYFQLFLYIYIYIYMLEIIFSQAVILECIFCSEMCMTSVAAIFHATVFVTTSRLFPCSVERCIALKMCMRPSSFEREERERRRHFPPVFWEKRNVVLTRPPTRFL